VEKPAPTDHPVHELIAQRWSPSGFADRDVPAETLASLFEAARWAPSGYNEQPWRYVVATRDAEAGYARVLSCLVEPNQAWARAAPVLALGFAATAFERNGKPNRHALHDLGQATANLAVQATAEGLVVHQMAGILPERALEEFDVPEGFEAVTGIAIGYPVEDPDSLPEALRARDLAPRSRRPLGEIFFGMTWGEPAL
jgi:nitroreductase